MAKNWRCPVCGSLNPENRDDCLGCDYEVGGYYANGDAGYSGMPTEAQQYQDRDPAFHGEGFWIRALARVIDLVVHYIVGFIAFFFVGIVTGIVALLIEVSPDLLIEKLESTTLSGYALAILGYLAYHTLCEGLHGASLGKLICGLIVVQEDESPCGFRAALGRSLAFYIDGLFFGLVAAHSMSSSPNSQRLGDKWAHTIVVKRRNLQPTQLRSGCRFTIVFLGAVILEGSIISFSYLLKLAG